MQHIEGQTDSSMLKEMYVITHLYPNTNGNFAKKNVKIRAWLNNYMPQKIMDIITDPFHNIKLSMVEWL